MCARIGRRIEKLLINRNYARLRHGQAVSTVGDYVFDTTLVLCCHRPREGAVLGTGGCQRGDALGRCGRAGEVDAACRRHAESADAPQ